jgi:hypothetical protein
MVAHELDAVAALHRAGVKQPAAEAVLKHLRRLHPRGGDDDARGGAGGDGRREDVPPSVLSAQSAPPLPAAPQGCPPHPKTRLGREVAGKPPPGLPEFGIRAPRATPKPALPRSAVEVGESPATVTPEKRATVTPEKRPVRKEGQKGGGRGDGSCDDAMGGSCEGGPGTVDGRPGPRRSTPNVPSGHAGTAQLVTPLADGAGGEGGGPAHDVDGGDRGRKKRPTVVLATVDPTKWARKRKEREDKAKVIRDAHRFGM